MKLSIKTIIRIIRNLLFFFALIFLTFWLIFKDQDMNELINALKSVNPIWILIAVGIMIVYHSMEAYNVKMILKSLGNKISMLSAFKFTMIGFFFSSITPAATGGQPVEIYYMSKEKIPVSNATLALLIQVCGFQISTITYGVVCSVFNWNILSGFIWLFIIGLVINGFALTFILIAIFSKRLTQKLLNILMKIMNFFRIKDGIENYNESAIFIKSHMNEFTKAVLRVFVQMACYYCIPFCIYKSFGLNTYNIFQIFTMQAVVFTMVSSIPLPGSIGISETVFLGSFGVAFGNELLSGAMLLNRGISFYMFVLVSLIIVIINAIKMKNVKGEINVGFYGEQ